jgi:hypothetical protein
MNALLALRTFLRADAALNEYCTAHYGKAPIHAVRNPRLNKATDYPVLTYVLVKASGDGTLNEQELVSVVIGVNDPGQSDDIMTGHVRVYELKELVLTALRPGWLSPQAVFMESFTLFGDFGERHPIYELELQLPLMWRR